MSGFNFGNTAGGTGGGFSFSTPAKTTASTTGFSFGTPASTAAATTPAAGGFSFGAAPVAATTTTSAGTGFSFGATPTAGTVASTASTTGGFGFSATASKPDAPSGLSFGSTPAAKPNQSTGFGASVLTAPAPASTAPASSGFSFGTPASQSSAPATGFTLSTPQSAAAVKPTPTLPATTAAQLSFGGSKIGTATPQVPAPTVSAAPSLGLTLGAPAATATTLNLGTAASQASTAAGGLKLGTAVPATGGLSLGAQKTTASTGFGTTTNTTSSSLSTTTTTTAANAATPSMNYRQLEETINKWNHDLEEQEKNFLQQATHVNAWDRLLIENGEKITTLNTDVERVKVDQQRLEHELDFILAQQKELEELLGPLEKSTEQLPAISYQQHADLEREHTYQLAENVDGQLKRMVQDLKEVIDHLNANSTNQASTDPISQIAKILNAHMDSLQWVDQNTVLLQRKVEDVAKQAELRRKEQETSFRLAYD
ncbi:unnamed protein product [Owenia fusiformis]|uniref:Nucleoporin NSP1-like C-terminal domain-containing protein n=1 Tax=Owenia fusiformis TaxID=6347 RepID=A0A8S4P009_OWEFU|nr:unnamed protein product [Owenia fusiformis]